LNRDGVNFTSKTLISGNAQRDLVSYVSDRDYNIVLFELQVIQQDDENGGSTAPGYTTRLDTGEGIFDWTSIDSKVLSHSILYLPSPIGVYIKQNKPNEEINFQSLLLIWLGKKCESFALLTALRMVRAHSHLHLHVITHYAHFASTHSLNPENVTVHTILPSQDENAQINSIVKVNKFDLILVGAERTIFDVYQSDLILKSSCSALVLYNNDEGKWLV